jgi:long-chain acyl-CoA synthetase
MAGYLDRPAETARVLDAEGWLRTGDVGAFDGAGRLRITGRLKNLLVLATGKNVAPAPIEAAIEASPHVRQAVLLGDDRDATGVLIVPEGAPSPELLRQEVERLTGGFASFERPRRAVALPRALDRAHGELDRAGRPVRAAVIDHFPAEVAELFDRSLRADRRDTAEPEPADAPPDARPESTVGAPG